jgi:site-specific DNA recombinase
MKNFFAYIRVSTVRQGERGVSLQEQRDTIERYAARNGLEVIRWFDERETAAKRGRPIFAEMLKMLRNHRADGVIIHKIDRSARNLRDWADLIDLSEQFGFELRFANESVDLSSRGGRLSADIQAVVAVDYVRNLREEIRKGFYGRLKQGLYPMQAPLGYLNQGQGKPKVPDPAKAPLVRKAFELYATGSYSLQTLTEEMRLLGLRNRSGNPLSLGGLSKILNNPFYIGLIKLRGSGETFAGIHEPIVGKSLFDRVHMVLNGRTPVRALTHDFPFRKFMRCAACGYLLRGEKQKGRVYYRCHRNGCAGNCIREDGVDGSLRRTLAPLIFAPEEWRYLERKFPHLKDEAEKERQRARAAFALKLGELKERVNRLTDALIDRLIEKETYEERKAPLLMEQKEIEERQRDLDAGRTPAERLAELVELAGTAHLQYELGSDEEKRELLKLLGSNCSVIRKTVDFTMFPPFQTIANRPKISVGGASRDTGRTWDEILHRLVIIIRDTPLELFDRISTFLSQRRDADPKHLSPLIHQAASHNGNTPAG